MENNNFTWDAVQENEEFEFINFEQTPEGEVLPTIRFMNDKPYRVAKGKYGKDIYMFKVQVVETGDIRALGITSKGFLLELKKLLPLNNRKISVSRNGKGYDMKYTVKQV